MELVELENDVVETSENDVVETSKEFCEQVIVVPLIDGIFGASIPKLTWFGAIVSLVGIGLLECGGSPPCVSNITIVPFCTN